MATLQSLGTVRLRLRLGGDDYQETLHAVQGDTGRVLEFDVLDGNGAIVTDLLGVVPVLYVRRPDGSAVGSAQGTITGGVISIPVPSSLLAYAGETKAQIQLVDSANQHKLHDHLYRLQIEESLEPGASLGENLWFSLAELTVAIEDAGTAKSEIEQAIINNQIVTQTEFTEHKEDYATFVKSTTSYIIKKLPNGVKDSVDESANTFVKRVSDETILDGSENWAADTPWDTTDTKCFYVSRPYLPTHAQVSREDDKAVLTNGIPFFKRSGFETLNVEGLARTGGGNVFSIRINRSNLTTQDLIGFKSFLKANPISFIYQLATPEIKPIDDFPINSKLVAEQQIKIKNLIDNQEGLAYVANPYTMHMETSGNTIYIKFELLNIRNLIDGGGQVRFSTLGEKYPDRVKTSPSGVEGCIELLDREILAYDLQTKTMVILPWEGYRARYICLIYNIYGRVEKGTFQEHYNDRRLKSLEQKIEEIPESPQQGDIIPSYWESHLTSKIGQISQLQNECGKDGTSFGFITDTHIGRTAPVSGLLVQNIMKSCDIPFFINGGDYVSGKGNATKDSIINEVKLSREMFGEYISRVLIAEGNHDTAYSANLSEEPIYYYAKNFTSEETYNYLFRHNAIYPQRVMGDDGKYFYQDDTFNKVRYIILNTSDLPYVVDAEGYSLKQYNKMRRSIMREEQVRWFSNVALDVPNDEWSVVVCSHIEPYSTYLPVIHGDMVARILQAFKDKAIYTGTSPANVDEEFKFSIDVDFTDKGGNIICWISGHMHNDSINRNRPADISFNIIETLNDSLDRRHDAPLKTKGTNTEQAFDIFTINKKTRNCYITRIGAGTDRQFSY